MADLCKFSLKGLKLVGTVYHIVDGDTMDVRVTIPLKVLEEHMIPTGRSKTKQHIIRFHGGYDDNTSMEILVRCRFYAIDAYEKNTEEGKQATISLKNHIQEGSQITCDFLDKGKFGRYITEFFIEGESLNKMLLAKYPKFFRTYEERISANK